MNAQLEQFISENTRTQWQYPDAVPRDLWASDWPWAPLLPAIPFDGQAIIEELQQVDHLFVEHRANDKIHSYGHEGWYSLVLHGIDETKTENYDRYGFKSQEEANYRWTDVCSIIPQTADFVKQLPFTDHGRVRIMRLAPGGHIMPHTDGPGRIFGPFNFALNNPPGCQFVFKDRGTVPFEPGLGMFLDIGRQHAIVNKSDTPRYHVIIHGRPIIPVAAAVEYTLQQLKK
jgi:hypothetical protein